jgi:nucleotidyltransferase/DNA polymerase involved in DNA repair
MTLMACVHIPHFAIAVAQRSAPADRPLILYTPRPRATVYAAAPQTRVETGLPLRQAMLRAPHAICRPASPKEDQNSFATLVALVQTFSPRVEAGDILPDATVECDLGRRTLPQAMTLADRITAAIRAQLQFLPALGFARTRFVAGAAAATAGAGTAIVVPPGYEATFLAPLPIGLLPLDVEMARRLDHFGLRTIGALAAVPIDAMQVQFGASGRVLLQLANGIDPQPIGADEPAACIEVSRRFEGPLARRHLLELVLRELAAQLAVSLTNGGWAACDVVMTLTLADDLPWTSRRVLTEPTSDVQLLAQALIALLSQAVLDTGIEAITVQVTDLSQTVAAQLELFAPEHGTADRLRGVLHRLSTRYSGCFVQARLAEPDAYVPEQRVQFTTLTP